MEKIQGDGNVTTFSSGYEKKTLNIVSLLRMLYSLLPGGVPFKRGT